MDLINFFELQFIIDIISISQLDISIILSLIVALIKCIEHLSFFEWRGFSSGVFPIRIWTLPSLEKSVLNSSQVKNISASKSDKYINNFLLLGFVLFLILSFSKRDGEVINVLFLSIHRIFLLAMLMHSLIRLLIFFKRHKRRNDYVVKLLKTKTRG